MYKRLAESRAVALLGPRQVGKTTLAQTIAKTRPSIYLDLESDRDRAKLTDPEAYLETHEDALVEVAPTVEKGFHQACADIIPTRRILIYPDWERYQIGRDVDVMSVDQAARALQGDLPPS